MSIYDKLGDLLNDALEKGEIPKEKPRKDKSQVFFNGNEIPKQVQNDEFTNKMHKYTENMYIPPHIQQALSTLDIVYPTNWNQIKKQYRKLLKQYHPDTKNIKNTIQNSQNVQNFRHLTVQDIQNAYEILDSYFNNKGKN